MPGIRVRNVKSPSSSRNTYQSTVWWFNTEHASTVRSDGLRILRGTAPTHGEVEHAFGLIGRELLGDRLSTGHVAGFDRKVVRFSSSSDVDDREAVISFNSVCWQREGMLVK